MTPAFTAALWMTGAILSFSSLAVAGREAMRGLDVFELLLYRSAIGILLVLAVARLAGTAGRIMQVTRGDFRLHLLRNVFHFTGQVLWYHALARIPLAMVFALEFTSPIWVVVMAPLLLGERLTATRALTALLGFAGILIVARPDPGHIDAGTVAAALAAVGFAGSAIFTRRLTRSTGLTEILFFLTAMQGVMALALAGADGAIAWPALRLWPWLGLIAVAGLVAHLCLTQALALAPASVVIPIDFARLPLIALVGMLLYGEPLDLNVLLGGAVIFLANYLNIRHETRHFDAK